MAHYSSSSGASRDQQNVAFGNENNIGQLLQGLGLCEDYWKIVKTLTLHDVNRQQCRLLLPKRDAEEHILDLMQGSDAEKCRSIEGLIIDVYDADDGLSFKLRLKKWSAGSYVLIENWIPDFVTRRGLQAGDKVGLRYVGSTLYFKLLN